MTAAAATIAAAALLISAAGGGGARGLAAAAGGGLRAAHVASAAVSAEQAATTVAAVAAAAVAMATTVTPTAALAAAAMIVAAGSFAAAAIAIAAAEKEVVEQLEAAGLRGRTQHADGQHRSKQTLHLRGSKIKTQGETETETTKQRVAGTAGPAMLSAMAVGRNRDAQRPRSTSRCCLLAMLSSASFADLDRAAESRPFFPLARPVAQRVPRVTVVVP
jgi:hypothetical protein